MAFATKQRRSRGRIISGNVLEYAVGESKPRVDRMVGVIRGVKIIGTRSQNNRSYPAAVLAKAKAHYEGRSVNISHPSREKVADDRPFESLLGALRSVAERDDGLYGDLHYIKSHPLAEMVCEAAERFPNNFGLSQNAHVNWLVKEDGHRVCESVNSVRSVDLVCRPATTNGIFESVQPSQPGGGNGENRTGDQLKALLGDDYGIDDTSDSSADRASLKETFRKIIAKLVDDETLDYKERIGKLREMLKLRDSTLARHDELNPPVEGGEELESVYEEERRTGKRDLHKLAAAFEQVGKRGSPLSPRQPMGVPFAVNYPRSFNGY